ncbi:MAG: hypothetical protein IPK67_18880 [Planctomycetes bacterium]|nr:hypothetical protein [Planctomycetota bacterium]
MRPAITFVTSAVTLTLAAAAALLSAATPPLAAKAGGEVQLSLSRIYWEYNASANDLGVHVTLDGEDWKALRIKRPDKQTIFEVKGKGAYKQLGMTELFFEGAEPSLDAFPLHELLSKFPEGEYDFEGLTVDNEIIEGESMFSHAIPAGPQVSTQQGPNSFLRVSWTPVTTTPPGFPARPIVIAGYQVIVGRFLVTLPASATSVTVPPEFVASLAPGVQPYEVLAIEANGNQTLTEGTFVK